MSRLFCTQLRSTPTEATYNFDLHLVVLFSQEWKKSKNKHTQETYNTQIDSFFNRCHFQFRLIIRRYSKIVIQTKDLLILW